MKTKLLLITLLLIALTASFALADDGQMFRRNISKTPDGETESAAIAHMTFYVPAQTSDGTLTTIEYYDAGGVQVDTRDFAKPLVSAYIDGIEEVIPEGSILPLGGVGFGMRDAHSAVSLDDGDTWKRTNLSLSADLSSFTLANGHEYPGDVHYMTFALAGDKVLAGWVSKYCDGGSPGYTWTDDLGEPIYPDYFGVAGAQKSVDYTGQGYPEVGEIPYSCIWSARGTLLQDPDTGLYDIIWTKAERLTSGRRDANRLEMAGDSASGFMMVWQEDPEGLRPGQGLGPGEGWSGAVVNQKTDLWYSYISWDDFDMVQTSDDDPTPIPISDYTGDTTPKVALPMAVPVRLTDNNMCKSTNADPYCYADFSTTPPTVYDTPQPGVSTFCSEVVSWTNPGGTTLQLCQTQDGRVLTGRVGASRPRVNVQPYDRDGDGINDAAWVIMAHEESKALGEGGTDPDAEPEDIGKNEWYLTFDLLNPNVVAQGGMLNQPAICNPYAATQTGCTVGDFFPMLVDDFGNEFYETEIARRFSLMSQPYTQFGNSGTAAVLIYKDGIINQGGPADIFLRRLVIPEDFDPQTDNPYAYENIACDEWAFTDGSNARYLQGLCLSDAINVSGTSIVTCDLYADPDQCAAAFPWDGGTTYPKVLEWAQTPDNLDDQAWENPYDVAKGHRGFIDGDVVMMMYAWAPNWKANSVGNDHYNLYVRRSFDGGLTWTTTPAELGGDGTTTCENYGHGSDIYPICTDYGPGDFEQARNVSQLIGNKVTILDPRYTPSGGIKMLPITDTLRVGGGTLPYFDDATRDPSLFFVVYETGDNTTVAEGEAVPLDLFYSRASAYGDDYDLVEYYSSTTGEVTLGFDWLEHDQEDLSGEASNTANPGATFYYVVWNQWREDEHEHVSNSDIIFRRIMYLDTTDGMPTAAILWRSHPAASPNTGDLFFIGTAVDNDHMGGGIVAFQWRSSLDGILSTDKRFTIDSATLSQGLHIIYFTALDAEGNWAAEVSVPLLIADPLYGQQLPMISQP